MVTEYNNFKLSQRWDGAAYTGQLLGLLPKGLAWVFEKFLLDAIIQDVLSGDTWQDTYTSAEIVQDAIRTLASGHILSRLLSCFGEELARAESEAWRLINQTDPGVATDTLEDWERVLGLPEDCFADQVLTEEERQREAHAKLFSKYEVTDLDFYLDYATELGFSIFIVQIPIEYSPRIMGVARMNKERMGGRGGFSILQVIIVSGDSDSALLKCAFSKVKQAHVVITYVGPDFVGPELFVDGDMEVTGPDVIVDGDMEVTGPDVIVDGDMEVTGPDVIVDGDMEAVGVAAWTASANAVLTKQGSPHSGTQCLRATCIAAGFAAAQQTIMTPGKTYRIKGWARSDGVVIPRIYENGSGTGHFVGTTSTSWQPFDYVYLSAFAGRLDFAGTGTGAGDYIEWDDVEIIDETVACAAYTPLNSALLSKQGNAYEGAQCLRVEYGGVVTPGARQTILTPGKTYRARGRCRGDGASGLGRVYDGGAVVWTGTISTSWQEFDEVFVAGSTTFNLYGYFTVAGYAEFDDVEVIDETVACAAWTPLNAPILSKQEDPHGGVQCLRIAHSGSNNPTAFQTILTIGKTYRVVGFARGDGNVDGVPRLRLSDYTTVWNGVAGVAWQAFNVTFVASATGLMLYSNVATITHYVEWDDIETIDETVACADWTAGADTILSKQNDPYEGVQCLRVEQEVALTTAIASQTILAIGEIYRIKGWARSDGVLIPQAKDGSGAGEWTGTTSTDWQEINVVFIAGSQVYQLESLTGYGGVGDYVEFDITSIKAEF